MRLFWLKKEVSPKEKRRIQVERRCSELIRRLNDVRSTYGFASDDNMIDALIYEENAILCLLGEVYKSARAEGITIEPHERIKNGL